MTRRKIIFKSEHNKFYVTPEFNGDKAEFEFFGKWKDGCNNSMK